MRTQTVADPPGPDGQPTGGTHNEQVFNKVCSHPFVEVYLLVIFRLFFQIESEFVDRIEYQISLRGQLWGRWFCEGDSRCYG